MRSLLHLHREAFTSITIGASKPKIPMKSVIVAKTACGDFTIASKLCPCMPAMDGGPPGQRHRARSPTMPLNGLPAAPTQVVTRSLIRAHQRHHVSSPSLAVCTRRPIFRARLPSGPPERWGFRENGGPPGQRHSSIGRGAPAMPFISPDGPSSKMVTSPAACDCPRHHVRKSALWSVSAMRRRLAENALGGLASGGADQAPHD